MRKLISSVLLLLLVVGPCLSQQPKVSGTVTIRGASTVKTSAAEGENAIAGIFGITADDTSALINYNTTQNSRTEVEYGTTVSYGSSNIVDLPRYHKEHFAVLTGLTASTTYHARVRATTSSGTVTLSSDFTFTTAASSNTVIAMPAQVDSNMPSRAGAMVRTVKNSGGDFTPSQFQSALNAVTRPFEIVIDADVIISGEFTLPSYSSGSGWGIIRTANESSLPPEGTRISAAYLPHMPTIRSAAGGAPATQPVLKTVGNVTQNLRFIGIRITCHPDLGASPAANNGLVRIGTASETSISQLPHHIGFDRMYFEGIASKNVVRGIYWNAEDFFVVDSYFKEFVSNGADSQAMLGGTAKRARIVNCYIEAGGENVMVGDTDVTITGYTPSDWTFLYCQFAWPLKWKSNDPSYAGFDVVTKNNFEIKSGERFLLAGCLFGGGAGYASWWASEQTGGAIVLKQSNSSGVNPAVLLRDVLIYKCWGRKMGAVISINGSTWPAETSSDQSRRITFLDCLFEVDGQTYDNEDTGADSSSNVAGFGSVQFGPGDFRYVDQFSIIHVTFVNANGGDGRLHAFGAVPSDADDKADDFIIRDTIFGYRNFGIKADGQAEGTASLNAITDSANRVWGPNIVVGSATNYPTGQIAYLSAWASVQFANFNNGRDGGDFSLASGSPGFNTASDAASRPTSGKHIGADVAAVMRATTGVASH